MVQQGIDHRLARTGSITRKSRKRKKMPHQIFGHMRGVLNEVYLQNFLNV